MPSEMERIALSLHPSHTDTESLEALRTLVRLLARQSAREDILAKTPSIGAPQPKIDIA